MRKRQTRILLAFLFCALAALAFSLLQRPGHMPSSSLGMTEQTPGLTGNPSGQTSGVAAAPARETLPPSIPRQTEPQGVGISQPREGARTEPAPGEYSRKNGAAKTAEAGGEPAMARVVAGGSPRTFSPDALGLFPRVNIGLAETVEVSVTYPQGVSRDPVTIQSEDGGTLNGRDTVAQSRLNDGREVRFAFTGTREGGIYRVTLRKGFDEKRLEFWGGPEPALPITNP